MSNCAVDNDNIIAPIIHNIVDMINDSAFDFRVTAHLPLIFMHFLIVNTDKSLMMAIQQLN